MVVVRKEKVVVVRKEPDSGEVEVKVGGCCQVLSFGALLLEEGCRGSDGTKIISIGFVPLSHVVEV